MDTDDLFCKYHPTGLLSTVFEGLLGEVKGTIPFSVTAS